MATIGEDHLPQKNSVSTEERVATENTASARREVRGSFRDTPHLKNVSAFISFVIRPYLDFDLKLAQEIKTFRGFDDLYQS